MENYIQAFIKEKRYLKSSYFVKPRSTVVQQRIITINNKYNGPPISGNGGYVSGMLAQYIDSHTVGVRLHAPPPLDKAMAVIEKGDQRILMKDDIKIATAGPKVLNLEVPDLPKWEETKKSTQKYRGFMEHAFPTCFVCGPERSAGDGLRIFSGLCDGYDVVASPFYTHDKLYDGSDIMYPEFIWAAADCTGAYAITELSGVQKVLVLGELTLSMIEPVRKGESLMVIGWYLGTEGKKNYAGTVIANSDKVVKAKARAIWIEVKKENFY